MLLAADDIVRYQGNIEITQLGGEVITGYGEISMSKDTGVVFIAQYVNNDLDKFTVGAFNAQGLLEEKRDYTEKTEKDFFNAVNYFEELIKSRQPEEESAPPSIGKFYFFKKSIGRDAYVSIQGMEDIIIDEADIPTVFSPPSTKPLGRLNLKDSTNPKYDPIKAKFALKYLEEEATEMAAANNWNLSDFAIYNMTPYEIGDENEGQPPPDEVNPINPNDIEDEDLQKKPEDEEPEKQEKPKPKVGDIIKIKENYGIVESIDSNNKIKVRKLTKDEAMNILSERRGNSQYSGASSMALGGEIKDEDEDFLYLEIDDENSEIEILSLDEAPSDEKKDSDEIPFFRVPNTSLDILNLFLYVENIKTGDITNKQETYQFIVTKVEGDNFKGTAVGLDLPGEATLVRKIKYDGADGTGYLLLAEGEGGEDELGEPNNEISFVLVSNIYTNTIAGDLYSKNTETDEIKNLNKSIVFNIEDRNPNYFKGTVTGIDGKVIMKRVPNLDQQNREAYYLLQEGDDEPNDKKGEPLDITNEDDIKELPPVNPKDLKEALEQFSNTNDLKKTYRKQKNLITALSFYNENELGKLLTDLKLPANTNKQQFINLVEKETKTIFN
jgi:hypothetical protein